MKLDLGCGRAPAEGYVGVDLPIQTATSRTIEILENLRSQRIDERGIIRFDLASGVPWPFEDGSIEGLYSSHVIEHLPAAAISVYSWQSTPLDPHRLSYSGTQDALFWFLDEAWRVCRAGAEFILRWPALRDQATREVQLAPFLDPTHYRFIPVEQALYWSRAGRAALGVEQYRARCNWIVQRHTQNELGGGALRVVEAELLLVKEL